MRIGGWLVAAGLAAAWSGAAEAATGHAAREAFVREVEEAFPADTWLTGVGLDEESAERAEARAVADAAARVASTVQANLGSVSTERVLGGASELTATVREELQRKVTSTAGALIQPRRERTRREPGAVLAVAAVRRDVLDQHLAEEARAAEARLRGAAARQAAGAGWQERAQAWCEVQQAAAALDARSLERFAVSRRTFWVADLAALRAEAAARQARERSGARAVVTAQDPAVGPAAAAVIQALTAGKVAVAEGAACGDAWLQLELGARSDCRLNGAGVQACRLAAAVTGRDCRRGDVLFRLESPEVTAVDTYSAERARQKAAAKVSRDGALAAMAADVRGRVLALLGEGCEP